MVLKFGNPKKNPKMDGGKYIKKKKQDLLNLQLEQILKL